MDHLNNFNIVHADEQPRDYPDEIEWEFITDFPAPRKDRPQLFHIHCPQGETNSDRYNYAFGGCTIIEGRFVCENCNAIAPEHVDAIVWIWIS